MKLIKNGLKIHNLIKLGICNLFNSLYFLAVQASEQLQTLIPGIEITVFKDRVPAALEMNDDLSRLNHFFIGGDFLRLLADYIGQTEAAGYRVTPKKIQK